MTADSRKIAPLGMGNYPDPRSKCLLTTREQIVQGLLKMRRRFRELATNLLDILLIALLNFVFEELLQRAVA